MTTVMTRYGAVRGQVADGVAAFLGIPYAASPTGPLRFAAPRPPARWDGERDCRAFGPTPPKPDYVPPYDILLPEPNVPGSDWLNLNVWTPDTTARLPVMVWIHGGAFSNGNSAVGAYDGHAFGRDGVVLVSINYRLGVDGFALLPDAPPNRGLLDQIAALEWVRDNIEAFGGDPANVTIFGESAGGMSVTALLTMPQARGLFGKAISQSGAGQAGAAPADAALVTGELGAALGLPATAASLATVDIPTLIRAQATVRDALSTAPDPARFGQTIVASAMAFQPVVDGQVLAQHPLHAIAAGASADIPLLTGTTREEFRLFMMPSGLAALITDEILPGLLATYGVSPATAELYRANRPGASPGDVLCALLTDSYFRLPMLAVAEARVGGPAPTYVYEFGWRSPVENLGAAHAVELPFVFDTLAADETLGAAPPTKLARQMHKAWIRFAASADPGWPQFDLGYPVMTWDGQAAEVISDPRGDERLAWRQP